MYQATEIGRVEWDLYWSKVHQSNLLQSWEYGEAKAQAEGWRPVRFLIRDEAESPVALALVLTRTWSIFGGVARLNRGPLLLQAAAESQKDKECRQISCLRAVLSEALRRRWWVFQVAPELPEGKQYYMALRGMRLRLRANVPWASARLSLVPDEKDLLANLNGKWRNLLRKAEKSGLVVSCHEGAGPELETLVRCYRDMQQVKGFSGVSEPLLRRLAEQTGPAWRFRLFKATSLDVRGEVAGLLVSIEHGDSATYLIGYTNEVGRRLQANYLMLWQAIIHAKRGGGSWFDLGGLNAHTPEGVAHFKRGVQAVPYALVGELRGYFV